GFDGDRAAQHQVLAAVDLAEGAPGQHLVDAIAGGEGQAEMAGVGCHVSLHSLPLPSEGAPAYTRCHPHPALHYATSDTRHAMSVLDVGKTFSLCSASPCIICHQPSGGTWRPLYQRELAASSA